MVLVFVLSVLFVANRFIPGCSPGFDTKVNTLFLVEHLMGMEINSLVTRRLNPL